ncbi:Putative ABC-type amino acid transport/signal transduction systems, periplasmic component/domain [Nostocoides japonicum T1-X7]|uniref:Putative ABC-type amino acid transport/signal transduction systems, periplasmic component/domain n=1 Tax=Nostocoides japonicum T1-X7 TaxID=1194083 RepID=A0A077M6T4_9MICO|nr:ABC transporter substrate-binding protein [Tetrasphaera japonica]CCH79745.1 Putative ABC-type amino acid transport/signal transduction systems, periplasmic component/domain [Tetrasphaera japonica T1-X7]
MLRTRTLAVALVATSALALTACGSNSLEGSSSDTSSAASSIATPTVDSALAAKLPAKIKSAGKIVVGTDSTYQPNEYLDTDGKTIIGMDVDLFNAVMAKFGVKVDWRTASFESIILGVNSGKYDAGVSSFTINKDRLTQATMVSYFKAGTQWVTQKGNPKKVDPDNACGLSVAAQKGTVQQDDLTARSKKCTDGGKKAINVLIDADQAKVTAMVQSGKADAMAVDLPPAVAAVQLTNGALELLGEQYDSAPYGFVLPKKGSDEFAQAIVDALKALEADGTYKQILTKWKVDGGAISDFAVNPDVSS